MLYKGWQGPEGLAEAGIQSQVIHLSRVEEPAGSLPATGWRQDFGGEAIVLLESVNPCCYKGMLCLQNTSWSLSIGSYWVQVYECLSITFWLGVRK